MIRGHQHQHEPVWLRKGLTQTIRSSTTGHLVNLGHSEWIVDDAFTIIIRVPTGLSNPTGNVSVVGLNQSGLRKAK